MVLALPKMHHVAIVVADMEAAAADFQRRWGVSIEDVRDYVTTDAPYRGDRVTFTARFGFIRTGGAQIEVIQPVEGRSPYTDFLAANNGDGVHHLAYIVESIDAYLQQLTDIGEPPSIQLDVPFAGSGRVIYIEHVAHGPVIELVEMPKAPEQ